MRCNITLMPHHYKYRDCERYEYELTQLMSVIAGSKPLPYTKPNALVCLSAVTSVCLSHVTEIIENPYCLLLNQKPVII